VDLALALYQNLPIARAVRISELFLAIATLVAEAGSVYPFIVEQTSAQWISAQSLAFLPYYVRVQNTSTS
jgi:hypothetical protein